MGQQDSKERRDSTPGPLPPPSPQQTPQHNAQSPPPSPQQQPQSSPPPATATTIASELAPNIPYTNYSVEKAVTATNKKDSSKKKVPTDVLLDDPCYFKYQKLPTFTPLLGRDKGSAESIYGEWESKDVIKMASCVQQYYEECAIAMHTEQTMLNDKMAQMELACVKAHSLLVKHTQHMHAFSVQVPNVEALSTQVIRTQQAVAHITNLVLAMDKALDKALAPPPPSSSSSQAMMSSVLIYDSPVLVRSGSKKISRPKIASGSPQVYMVAKPTNESDDSSNNNNTTSPTPVSAHTRTYTPTTVNISDTTVWLNDIIPRWHEIDVKNAHWVRSLWRAGIPKAVRGQVWRLAIGNSAAITPDLYNELVVKSVNELESGEHKDIIVDLERTFSNVEVEGDIVEFRGKLLRVLIAYSKHKPIVGYVQGMSFVAAMLLQHMEECDAFISMVNLLENPFLSKLFMLDMDMISKASALFEDMLLQTSPKLSTHFASIGLISQHYLLQWWLPIFSKSLPVAIAAKIWDCFLLEGELFAFVAALGILRMYKKRLKELSNIEECKKLLSILPPDVDGELLFGAIESIPAPLYASFLSQLYEK